VVTLAAQTAVVVQAAPAAVAGVPEKLNIHVSFFVFAIFFVEFSHYVLWALIKYHFHFSEKCDLSLQRVRKVQISFYACVRIRRMRGMRVSVLGEGAD
jgi:hypothetical protein